MSRRPSSPIQNSADGGVTAPDGQRSDPEGTWSLNDMRVVLQRRAHAPSMVMPVGYPEEGARVGRYCVGRLLGEGGMARVYRAVDAESGQPVAFKVLKPQYQTDRHICARFEREALSMAQIQHDHVVRILGIAEDDHCRAIVMELLEGGSVRDLMKPRSGRQGEPLPVRDAVNIAIQAASGIEAAHRMGVVHRDVKPSNLMFTNARQVKVTDFGAILMIENATWLTGVGQRIGTPGYMSPEQCAGSRVTPASDVYSLGATLYELVTGRLPFEVEEASPFALMLKHISEPPPDPRCWRESMPDWLASAILTTLEKKPEHRFASAGVLAQVLEEGVASAEVDEEPRQDAERDGTGWNLDLGAVRRQLVQLPQRAIVCWACRCARRVQSFSTDPRVERALSMAESTVTETESPESGTAVTQALSRIRALRAASLKAAYTGEDADVSQETVEAARAAAAAAASAAARCVDDAAADAAFAARSAMAALEAKRVPVRDFWSAARLDFQILLRHCAGQEGTVGNPISPSVFNEQA